MKNAIIIPALEPQDILIDYINDLISRKLGEVIVVNDGSSLTKDYIFNTIDRMENCTVLSHIKNYGKGEAIKTAVKFILNTRSDIGSIITVDADGQHHCDDVEKIYRTYLDNQSSLILGVRDFEGNTPAKSKIGNVLSAKALKLLYNIDLNDTQTGLRAIGREYFHWLIDLPGTRYEYELNMLIYTKKISLEIVTMPIKTLYFNENEGSHYRAVKDSARIFSQMIKGLGIYIGNSAISALSDITVFSVMLFITQLYLDNWLAIAISASVARIVSSYIDFSLNHSYFANKESSKNNHIYRYYTLWSVQLLTSISIVNYIVGRYAGNEILIKGGIDLLLAMISYQIQLHWVFRSNDNGYKTSKGILIRGIRKIANTFIKKDIIGRNLPSKRAVLVGHHQNLYGPLMTALFLPETVHIWALSDFLSFKTCFRQYYKFTFTKRAGLPIVVAAPLAFVAAIVVPLLMKSARVIPVYRKSERIEETFNKTIELLEDDMQVMVFPDIYYNDKSPLMKEMYTGFFKTDQRYYDKTNEHIGFVPICYYKYDNIISVGSYIYFESELWDIRSKHFVADKIKNSINLMTTVGSGSNLKLNDSIKDMQSQTIRR